jgi:hypothetical protein
VRGIGEQHGGDGEQRQDVQRDLQQVALRPPDPGGADEPAGGAAGRGESRVSRRSRYAASAALRPRTPGDVSVEVAMRPPRASGTDVLSAALQPGPAGAGRAGA